MIKLARYSSPALITIVAVAALLTLNGCGWQLAGTAPLPPQLKVVHLDDNLDHDLSNALRQQLNTRGVLIVKSSHNALTQLKQLQFDVDRRTLTVDRDGKVAEYELQGIARLSVIRAGYDAPIEVTANTRLRLANDTARVLATQSDETNQTQLLVQELARKLLNQVAILTGKSG